MGVSRNIILGISLLFLPIVLGMQGYSCSEPEFFDYRDMVKPGGNFTYMWFLTRYLEFDGISGCPTAPVGNGSSYGMIYKFVAPDDANVQIYSFGIGNATGYGSPYDISSGEAFDIYLMDSTCSVCLRSSHVFYDQFSILDVSVEAGFSYSLILLTQSNVEYNVSVGMKLADYYTLVKPVTNYNIVDNTTYLPIRGEVSDLVYVNDKIYVDIQSHGYTQKKISLDIDNNTYFADSYDGGFTDWPYYHDYYTLYCIEATDSGKEGFSKPFFVSTGIFLWEDGIAVERPNLRSDISFGEAITLKYLPYKYYGTWDSYLYVGDYMFKSIDSGVEYIQWIVPNSEDVVNSTYYRIKIVSRANKNVYSFSEYFSLEGTLDIGQDIPKSGGEEVVVYYKYDKASFQYTNVSTVIWFAQSDDPYNANLYLDDDHVIYLCTGTAECSFIFPTSDKLFNSSKYVIRISSLDGSSMGESAFFFLNGTKVHERPDSTLDIICFNNAACVFIISIVGTGAGYGTLIFIVFVIGAIIAILLLIVAAKMTFFGKKRNKKTIRKESSVYSTGQPLQAPMQHKPSQQMQPPQQQRMPDMSAYQNDFRRDSQTVLPVTQPASSAVVGYDNTVLDTADPFQQATPDYPPHLPPLPQDF